MTGSSFTDFRDLFANPPQDVRPEVRWWLAEGLHTDETLRTEIEAAHRMGFGGMEFLAMDEGRVFVRGRNVTVQRRVGARFALLDTPGSQG